MQHIVLVIHLILAVALVAIVLLQRSEGAGLSGPSAAGMMPIRGTANILTRTTAVLAGGFMLTSLILAILANHQSPRMSLAEAIAQEQQQQLDANSVPVSDAPAKPTSLKDGAAPSSENVPAPAVAPKSDKK